jgi:ribonuclease R
MVHLSSVPDDFFTFDPVRARLVGRHSGRMIQLGDTLPVQVHRVDDFKKQVDFRMVSEVREERGQGRDRRGPVREERVERGRGSDRDRDREGARKVGAEVRQQPRNRGQNQRPRDGQRQDAVAHTRQGDAGRGTQGKKVRKDEASETRRVEYGAKPKPKGKENVKASANSDTAAKAKPSFWARFMKPKVEVVPDAVAKPGGKGNDGTRAKQGVTNERSDGSRDRTSFKGRGKGTGNEQPRQKGNEQAVGKGAVKPKGKEKPKGGFKESEKSQKGPRKPAPRPE